MPPLPPGISLTKAEAKDVDEMHELGQRAFEPDTHTRLKELVKGKPVFDDSHLDYLRSLLVHPRVEIVVARDVDEDKVAGHAIWIRRNLDSSATEAATTIPTAPDTASPPQQPPLPDHRPLTVADLEAITDQSMTEWDDFLSPPGVRCRAVAGVSVHPKYQGRGIGGALMRRGFEKCDEDGVYCWVQTSMSSRGHYASAGFVEVGKLELDLDLFAEGHQVPENLRNLTGGSERWGKYVWTYMRRDPVSGVSGSVAAGVSG